MKYFLSYIDKEHYVTAIFEERKILKCSGRGKYGSHPHPIFLNYSYP